MSADYETALRVLAAAKDRVAIASSALRVAKADRDKAQADVDRINPNRPKPRTDFPLCG